MDCSLPGSSVHGIPQARILEWVAISFSRASSRHMNWTQVSCTAGRFFTNWTRRVVHKGLYQSSVQLCLTLCNPMDCSTPVFFVYHQLLELAQIHVHWVGDAIQQFHPLSSPSPPALIFPSVRVFSESALCIRWPKYWSFSFIISLSNDYSGLIFLDIQDWLGHIVRAMVFPVVMYGF